MATIKIKSNELVIAKRLVTISPQKDKRTIIGTAVHLFEDCCCLTKTKSKIIDISKCPELVSLLRKCSFCYGNQTNK